MEFLVLPRMLALVLVMLIARSRLVASGNVTISINDDPDKSVEVSVGSKLLAAGATAGERGGAVLYDVRSGRVLARFGERKDAVLTAAVLAMKTRWADLWAFRARELERKRARIAELSASIASATRARKCSSWASHSASGTQ